MCTVILDIEPGAPALLAGIRDELTDRPWRPPGWHWPDHPGLIGGLDLQAGGTWLAVAPAAGRLACVLNGRGRNAAAASRRSRGVLPLQAAGDAPLDRAGLADFDPFHLLSCEPQRAVLHSWDGERLTQRELTAGLQMIVNSGLGGDVLAGDRPAGRDGPAAADRPGCRAASGASERELARLRHFLPRLRAAARPAPRPGIPVSQAWGEWLPLVDGDGIAPGDPRALLVRRDIGGGRTWGTTSVSLVALGPDGVRYDFSGDPGNPAAWYPVSVARE
jgi:Transport and Golgi organisation 2